MFIKLRVECLKAVSFAISKESTRYYLQGVCFDKQGVLVATDGYRLAAIRPKQGLGAWCSDNFILPADTIKKILSVKTTMKKAALYFGIDTETKIASVFHEEGKGNRLTLASFSFYFIDGTFPDWRRAIPTAENFNRSEKSTGLNAQGFNSKYLGDFSAFGKSVNVFMNTDPQAPCVFRANEAAYEALGVLMPIRVDDFFDVVPIWAVKATLPAASESETAPDSEKGASCVEY
jgi:DNA polymerase III sliding clamp (beta) subunit (PCNA family)